VGRGTRGWVSSKCLFPDLLRGSCLSFALLTIGSAMIAKSLRLLNTAMTI
jgi:hypothetical protein